jgi:NADPH:quinone reductase-like Zn-dependent oxidoreductase
LIHKPNRQNLAFKKELLESGKIQPVIDRQYTLSEVPEGVRYLDGGNHQSKVVITM